MKIVFYQTAQKRVPVKDFIEKLELQERVHVLGCLQNVAEMGFEALRVQFKPIHNNTKNRHSHFLCLFAAS